MQCVVICKFQPFRCEIRLADATVLSAVTSRCNAGCSEHEPPLVSSPRVFIPRPASRFLWCRSHRSYLARLKTGHSVVGLPDVEGGAVRCCCQCQLLLPGVTVGGGEDEGDDGKAGINPLQLGWIESLPVAFGGVSAKALVSPSTKSIVSTACRPRLRCDGLALWSGRVCGLSRDKQLRTTGIVPLGPVLHVTVVIAATVRVLTLATRSAACIEPGANDVFSWEIQMGLSLRVFRIALCKEDLVVMPNTFDPVLCS